MIRTPFLFLAATVAVLVGCSSGNHLVGTWASDTNKMEEVLRDDGTLTIKYQNAGSNVTLSGTYSYSGNILESDIKKVEVEGGTHTADVKALLDRTMVKVSKTPLEWQDNDHFSVIAGQDRSGYTLHRIK